MRIIGNFISKISSVRLFHDFLILLYKKKDGFISQKYLKLKDIIDNSVLANNFPFVSGQGKFVKLKFRYGLISNSSSQ